MPNIQHPSKLVPLNNENKVLLHSCCACCSCDIIERMVDSKINFTVFYYNPNIFPQEEYEKRKQENKRFAKKFNVDFIDGDFDQENWLSKIKGLEQEPERGARCCRCFDIRLKETARYANENGFKIFATSLGISRWKDLEQINQSGTTAAKAFSNLIFWDFNWRKQDGSIRMYKIAKHEKFYMQKYCGCVYSF